MSPKQKKARRKYNYPDRTTIWVRRSTLAQLDEVGKRGETPDDILRRVLSGVGEVWVDVLAVDGDSPARHTVLFKMGDFPYMWDGDKFAPVDPGRMKTVVEEDKHGRPDGKGPLRHGAGKAA